MPDLSASHGSATRATWQEAEPIPCSCRKARLGILGPHRDWLAEYARNRRLGLVLDDFHFSAVAIEGRLDPSELAR